MRILCVFFCAALINESSGKPRTVSSICGFSFVRWLEIRPFIGYGTEGAKMCHYNFIDMGSLSTSACEAACTAQPGCNELSISSHRCRIAKDATGCCACVLGANVAGFCTVAANVPYCAGGCAFHSITGYTCLDPHFPTKIETYGLCYPPGATSAGADCGQACNSGSCTICADDSCYERCTCTPPRLGKPCDPRLLTYTDT